MSETNSSLINTILKHTSKPSLFEPGEPYFWDDPHISKGMLEAHLTPDNDLASRKHASIDKEVEHLVSSGILKAGDRILDLGCGPGLYSIRLAERGMKVTGVDISERSLNFAIAQSKEKDLDTEFRLINFFDIDYTEEFDAVIQTHAEMNTFPDEKRDKLLALLHQALKPGGLFIFDVTTRETRMKYGEKNGWHVSDGGFWRPDRHLILTQGYDYPEDNVWLDQYIIIDSDNVKVYNNWFHDYDLQTIRQILQKAGFEVVHAWNDLTGTPHQEGGDWIALVGRRI